MELQTRFCPEPDGADVYDRRGPAAIHARSAVKRIAHHQAAFDQSQYPSIARGPVVPDPDVGNPEASLRFGCVRPGGYGDPEPGRGDAPQIRLVRDGRSQAVLGYWRF